MATERSVMLLSHSEDSSPFKRNCLSMIQNLPEYASVYGLHVILKVAVFKKRFLFKTFTSESELR